MTCYDLRAHSVHLGRVLMGSRVFMPRGRRFRRNDRLSVPGNFQKYWFGLVHGLGRVIWRHSCRVCRFKVEWLELMLSTYFHGTIPENLTLRDDI
jgi:hypothetical protein